VTCEFCNTRYEFAADDLEQPPAARSA
jgi:redox-regulated HSP33 family molecular chaperone